MKTLVYIFKVVMVLVFTSHYSNAQNHFSCSTQKKLDALYETHPELRADQEALIEQSKHFVSGLDDREAVYTIPVVFHILHENGVENISDAQIYDQMEIINRDFAKLNADTTEIVSEFQSIAANAQIEFRLANKDPFGNCTNGIEHIYSHETYGGDDHSKLNQWPRSRYLNVWVVSSMQDGAAGYSYYPSAVSSDLFYADGIIVLHEYIGSIGTGSVARSRTLTHEAGHWLGLPHVWGNNNSPEVECGDDGIEDTPITAGHLSCNLTDTSSNCTEGVIENIQNYMEYSYCSKMFTEGQSAVMQTSLENIESARNNLHTESNRVHSGVVGTPDLCTPLPDFYTNNQMICAGQEIQYFASVSRAEVTSYNWFFPGGTPSISSEANPIVSYATPGIYDATLSVTNAAGSESTTKLKFAHILGDYWKYSGPHSEDFENDHFETDGWYIQNPEDNEVYWEQYNVAGRSGNNSIGLNYHRTDLDPIIDLSYYDRIGGTKDIVISPSFNLSNTNGAILEFSYIFATTYGGVFDPEQMELKVSYWKDCASSWNTLQSINNAALICAGQMSEPFYPNSTAPWNTVSIELPASLDEKNVRFKIELTAVDGMNNFFIDDFNISGLLSTGSNNAEINNFSVYPNPSRVNDVIQIKYVSAVEENMNVNIYDLLGNHVHFEQIQSTTGLNKHMIDLKQSNLAAGMYEIVVETNTSKISKKLILN